PELVQVRLVQPIVLLHLKAPIELAELLLQLRFGHLAVSTLRHQLSNLLVCNSRRLQLSDHALEQTRDGRAARPVVNEDEHAHRRSYSFAQVRSPVGFSEAARK